MSQTLIEQHIHVTEKGQLLIDLLATHTPLSKQKLKNALIKGCVWQTLGKKTQRVRRAKKLIQQGSEVHLYYNEKILTQEVPTPTLISDRGEFSVWDKPTGMLSQGSKWGDHSTLPRWAEQHLKPQRNSFIVHRLDRAASGIMMLAHSKFAAAQLSRLFAQRQVFKRYQARVIGRWNNQETLTINQAIDGKPAVSHVKLLSSDQTSSLVEVVIETGYKHQIRRHLASLNFPILGDRLYGAPHDIDSNHYFNANTDAVDLQLRAVEMSFIDPFSDRKTEFYVDKTFASLYREKPTLG